MENIELLKADLLKIKDFVGEQFYDDLESWVEGIESEIQILKNELREYECNKAEPEEENEPLINNERNPDIIFDGKIDLGGDDFIYYKTESLRSREIMDDLKFKIQGHLLT